VLAKRHAHAPVAGSVAPSTGELGVMFPYTPLHHLLLGDFATLGGGALVLTSGNASGEPIAYDDADALDRLAGIADAFLVHDRQIHIRLDDSVVRVVRSAGKSRELPIRRSRGYVPCSLQPPGRRPEAAACLWRRAEEHLLRCDPGAPADGVRVAH
jgi:hydrogenase maturation protein HypF